MDLETSFTDHMTNVVDIRCDNLRIHSLRKITARLLPPPAARTPPDIVETGRGSRADEEWIDVRMRQQAMARAFHTTREQNLHNDLNELSVHLFAKSGEKELVICALAHLTANPVTSIESAFNCETNDMIFVLCRSLNFAWSTMRDILILKCGESLTEEKLQLECDVFHEIPVKAAQRVGRFLQLQLSLLNR